MQDHEEPNCLVAQNTFSCLAPQSAAVAASSTLKFKMATTTITPPLPEEIEDPTWFGHIQHFFGPDDIQCMKEHVDLSSYEVVKKDYKIIWDKVSTQIINKLMPKTDPPGMRQWPLCKLRSFQNWKKNGFKKGVEPSPRDRVNTAEPNPNFERDIQYMFLQYDIQEMRFQNVGVDLGDYDGVAMRADDIYDHVKSKKMPLGHDKWSDDYIAFFSKWMEQGKPRTATSGPFEPHKRPITFPFRIRRNVKDLDSNELELLHSAFSELMKRDIKAYNSFYSLADDHRRYCVHHADHFLPWHRLHLLEFENALRSLGPAYENLTLPYWDFTNITNDDVDIFFNEARYPYFYRYRYPDGSYTQRYEFETMKANYLQAIPSEGNIKHRVNAVLRMKSWNDFDGFSASACTTSTPEQGGLNGVHDTAHNATGPTFQSQTETAFDPLFWFFHCNWDRLWWKWQNNMSATTLDGFLANLKQHNLRSDWVTNKDFNQIAPWYVGAAVTIDSLRLGIDYDEGKEKTTEQMSSDVDSMKETATLLFHPVEDAARIAVVLVEDLDRSLVPGSFSITLLIDGVKSGVQDFFQAPQPKRCKNCQNKPKISFRFRVPKEKLEGKTKESIECKVRHVNGTEYPLDSCGGPTVTIQN